MSTALSSKSGHRMLSRLRPCTMLSFSWDSCTRVLSSGNRPRFNASYIQHHHV